GAEGATISRMDTRFSRWLTRQMKRKGMTAAALADAAGHHRGSPGDDPGVVLVRDRCGLVRVRGDAEQPPPTRLGLAGAVACGVSVSRVGARCRRCRWWWACSSPVVVVIRFV